MKTDTQTAYSVLFRNEDGSLRGTIPGSTPECAIRAASALEGQEVFGFATISVEPEPISGMRFVLREVGPKAEPVVLTASPKAEVARLVEALAKDDTSVEIYGPGNHGGQKAWLVALRNNDTDLATEYQGDTLLEAFTAAQKEPQS